MSVTEAPVQLLFVPSSMSLRRSVRGHLWLAVVVAVTTCPERMVQASRAIAPASSLSEEPRAGNGELERALYAGESVGMFERSPHATWPRDRGPWGSNISNVFWRLRPYRDCLPTLRMESRSGYPFSYLVSTVCDYLSALPMNYRVDRRPSSSPYF
jgi:hypothetical protein